MSVPSRLEMGYLGVKFERENVVVAHMGNARNEFEQYQPATMRDAQPTYYGTDRDASIGLQAAAVAQNTAFTTAGMYAGTPVGAAIPANSLIISNITANADIIFYSLLGGTNTTEWLRVDTSAGDVLVNANAADWDFVVASDNNANAIHVDGGLNGGIGNTGLGRAPTADVSLYIEYPAVTAVGTTYYQMRFNSANAITLAQNSTDVATAYFRAPTVTVAGYSLDNCSTVYIGTEPTAATNNYILWVETGTVRLDSRVDMGLWADSTKVAASAAGWALRIGADTQNFSNGSSTLAIGATVTLGIATLTGDTATLTFSNAATLYIAGIPVASTNTAFTTPAYAAWIDAGPLRLDGNLDLGDGAVDILMKAATAAALEISDGTTKFYALDTRVATAGVTTHTWNISDYTFAAAAGDVVTGWSFAAHTLTYTGGTGVTTQVDTVVIGARTITDTTALAVTEANSLLLVAPIEGGSVTLAAASALRIVDTTGTPTNQYGIFIETLTSGATADYAIWVAGANAIHMGTAGTATGLWEVDGATSGTVTFTVAAAAGTWTMTFPATAGSNGDQLATNGSGVCSWTAAGSLREYKEIAGLWERPRDALDMLLGTSVYRFHYREGKGTLDTRTEYVGVMADESPWAMHYDGRVLNPVNTFGYTVLAVQALHQENQELKRRVEELERLVAGK